MRALLIGGTGTISTAVTKLLLEKGWTVTLLNRGSRADVPEGVEQLHADIRDEDKMREALRGRTFDTVCEFIGFVPSHVEQDIRVLKDMCGQYIYISSASAYHKPVPNPVITEGTSLANPYWQYSRDKIACEEILMHAYRENRFPVTIVRPSHTYSERSVPVAVHGDKGSFQVLSRILQGKPVIIHGDGSSLWTLTFNTDFAKGFVGLMGNPATVGEAFHITSDESLTWNQIMLTLAAALNRELIPCYVSSETLSRSTRYDFRGTLIGDKACSVIFDNGKLKRFVPDYKAVVPFCEGVHRCIDYIFSHPECQVPDPDFDEFCDRAVEKIGNLSL